MCDCLKNEETLIAAGQLLPEENEVSDDYKGIVISYCPECGTKLDDVN